MMLLIKDVTHHSLEPYSGASYVAIKVNNNASS